MTTVHVPFLNRSVVVHSRDVTNRFRAAHANPHPEAVPIPTTALPVDGTNGMSGISLPIDHNDQYGTCGEAMAAHVDNVLTFGQGKPGWTESVFDQAKILSQYLRVSGGDNGLSEQDVVDRIWKVGIAGVSAAVIADSLDIDITNVNLTRYLIDQFYAVCMAWSVPDQFFNDFATGATFANPGIPNPNNGHFTPLVDVTTDGYYRIVTWGSWCWASPSFVHSVQPQSFCQFSARQFNSQGFDSKGRHVSAQAAAWVAMGGSSTAVAKVVAMFPPLPGPTPVPVPVPPTPTPTPTPVPTPVPPTPPDPPGNIILEPGVYEIASGCRGTVNQRNHTLTVRESNQGN